MRLHQPAPPPGDHSSFSLSPELERPWPTRCMPWAFHAARSISMSVYCGTV